MSRLTIITNNVPRDVISWRDVPQDVREDDFDYYEWSEVEQGALDPTFFKYKDEWYDLDDGFEKCYEEEMVQKGWHAARSDSFFSGILIRYVDDFERVVVGRYYS